MIGLAVSARAAHRRGLGSLGVLVLVASCVIPAGSASAELIPARPAVVRGNDWHLRDSLTSGFADEVLSYGGATDVPLMGDWDGDGVKTPGVLRGNTWYLRNSNTSGFADVVFSYGKATDIPVVGDWDGDGADTPGVVRVTESIPEGSSTAATVSCSPGFNSWYLRNANSEGAPDEVFVFGCPGVPIAGDWDGDGVDTPGVRVGGSNLWALNNAFDETPDVTLTYGNWLDFPISGDWDDDESESVGVVRGNVWHLKNQNTSGFSDLSFAYGKATDYPLVWGDAGTT